MKRNENEYVPGLCRDWRKSWWDCSGWDLSLVSISVNPPIFHPRLGGTSSVSCILPLRKATVIWPKYSFSFHLISICLSDAHPRAGRCSRLSYVSATLSPFHFCLFPAFPGFPYYTTQISLKILIGVHKM